MVTRKLIELLVGLSVPEGDEEGKACQQGVWAEGEARHKRATEFSRVAGYLLSAALSQGGQHRGFLEGGSEKKSWPRTLRRPP